MRIPKPLAIKGGFSTAAALLALTLLPACSVSVKDHDGEGKSKVDIQTPVGGIHVDENAHARDAGVPIYPGARPKPKTNDGEEKSANVNISTFGFGVKVVALEYESDDPPAKVIAYYQDQLKRFGKVLQCHTSSLHADDHVSFGSSDSKGREKDKELKCDGNDNGKAVELKSGTKNNQHVVSVEPQGTGSDFAVVWIRLRGKEKEGDI